MFTTYFQLGFEHITDLNGYDHILFLIALCAAYSYTDWRSILILVTAFTVGHSITLALAVLNIIPVSAVWIEFLIPLTIFITALKNIVLQQRNQPIAATTKATYVLALGFGLIHGMGFSNFLRSLLGDELTFPLFAFNVGLEVGQLIIVALIFGVQAAILHFSTLKHAWWNIGLSTLAAGVSVLLMAERIPF